MKIRNAQCFSCLCVQSRKNANRKTFAPQTFSLMNVFFIKIKIFVGTKFLSRGEKMFDDFSTKSDD